MKDCSPLNNHLEGPARTYLLRGTENHHVNKCHYLEREESACFSVSKG